jgi:enolase
VKATLEISDPVFKKAKARAAERGIPLRQYVTEAVQQKLRTDSEKPWMKTIGGLRHMHKENVRIQRIIDEEFEKIDPEEWI